MNHWEIFRETFSNDVSDETLKKLYTISEVRTYPPKVTLCKQNERATAVFVLLHGTVKVYSEIGESTIHLDTIRHGPFGEIGLLLDGIRTATLITTDETTVAEIKGRAFRDLASEHPEIAAELAKMVLRRMVEQDKKKIVELKEKNELVTRRESSTLENLKADKMLDYMFDSHPITDIAKRVFGRISAYGEPRTDLQHRTDVFMIMPFLADLKPVYEEVRKLSNDLGLILKRGDDPFTHRTIMSEIWALTNNAKVVICDCTGKNANVFYELGIAHTLGKRTILITQNKADIPFDLRQFRYILYENSPEGRQELVKKLRTAMIKMISQ